jgi:hypothetical protein
VRASGQLIEFDLPQCRRAGTAAVDPNRTGLGFSCSWSQLGRTFATIGVASRGDVVVLRFDTRGAAQEQHVRLTWSRITFGWRPWWRCACGRRAAKLYLGHGDAAFACRACHGLAYVSQSSPAQAAVTRAVAARRRVGGSGNLLDPFPPKRARGMRWRTYGRLLAAAIAAEERMLALDLDWLRTRHGVTLGPHEPERSGEHRWVPAAVRRGPRVSASRSRRARWRLCSSPPPKARPAGVPLSMLDTTG